MIGCAYVVRTYSHPHTQSLLSSDTVGVATVVQWVVGTYQRGATAVQWVPVGWLPWYSGRGMKGRGGEYSLPLSSITHIYIFLNIGKLF